MEPPNHRIGRAASAVSKSLRRGGPAHVGVVQAGAMLAVLGLVFGAVALGVRIPGHGLLGGLPRLTESEVAAGAVGPLAPISEDYAREVLGAAAYRRLIGEPAAGPAGDVARPRPGPSGSGPATTTTTTTPAGGLRVPPLVRPAKLTVAFSAENSTVRPGEIIKYTIRVTNVGDETLRGELKVDSHIPFGTRDANQSGCDDPDACVFVPLPVPGVPADTHQVTFSSNKELGAHDTRVLKFAVRVIESTRPGTKLTNHAHAEKVGDGVPAVTSNTVDVIVVAGDPVVGSASASRRSWSWAPW